MGLPCRVSRKLIACTRPRFKHPGHLSSSEINHAVVQSMCTDHKQVCRIDDITGGGGLFCQGKLHHPWKSQSSNCLTHTPKCKPMLRSESERFAIQSATESSIS